VQALKDALAALMGGALDPREADRCFVRAMIALGAPNNATAGAFGISEAELLAKFPDELGPGVIDLWPAEAQNTAWNRETLNIRLRNMATLEVAMGNTEKFKEAIDRLPGAYLTLPGRRGLTTSASASR
jgi:hypothetical protein